MAKAIFITGGGSGIGRAIAQRFAREGWFVGLGDVNEAGMAETAALLPDGQSASWTMDVRDREAWRATLDAFVERTGRLDVLANNAGIADGGPLEEAQWDALDRVIAINFVGALNGAKIGFDYLKRTPGSCLLNTASASAIYGSAGLVVYSATKFAVRALTEGLDVEWHKAGVKVRSLMPGFIDTPLLDFTGGSNQTARERVAASGLEFTPVAEVAEAAWRAVHSEKVHWPVGKTARRLTFAARWMPGRLRKQLIDTRAL